MTLGWGESEFGISVGLLLLKGGRLCSRRVTWDVAKSESLNSVARGRCVTGSDRGRGMSVQVLCLRPALADLGERGDLLESHWIVYRTEEHVSNQAHDSTGTPVVLSL